LVLGEVFKCHTQARSVRPHLIGELGAGFCARLAVAVLGVRHLVEYGFSGHLSCSPFFPFGALSFPPRLFPGSASGAYQPVGYTDFVNLADVPGCYQLRVEVRAYRIVRDVADAG
jgi:hypothetical protein